MKRFWTALAVALLAIFVVGGCNDYGNTFQNPGGAFLTGLSPSQVPACAPNSSPPCTGFKLTMIGAGFVAQTKVQWDGTTCQPGTAANTGATCTTTVTLDTNNNVTSVVANISAALIAKPGSASVNTLNPGSYGTGTNGFSNNITFLIGNPPNPTPAITPPVAPSCATAGSPLLLSVTGTNFLNTVNTTDPTQNNYSTLIWTSGSMQAQFSPASMPAATITSRQISVTIPATVVGSAAGSASITVSNPPSPPVPGFPGTKGSGGGTSSGVSLPIQASCPVAAKAPAASESSVAVAEETPAVSLDGRYVAYTAVQNGHAQIFFRDTCEGAPANCQPGTSLLSVTSDGEAAPGDSHTPSMSSDGRYVAFSSDAAKLVENPPPGRQIYLRDTCAGADASCRTSTILVSTDSRGALVGAESILPSVSSSGRFVAFLAVTTSHATQQSSAETKSPVGTANSGFRQVFIRDTCLGAANCTPKSTRVSLQPGDGSATNEVPAGPALSGKGKHVALAGANTTLFTHSVAVDDSVFLAIASGQR